MSTTSSIMAAIVSALQGATGLGTDRVVRGRPVSLTEGVSPPVCWVAAGKLTSDHGPDLTSYTRTLLIDVVAVPAAESSTYGDREDACYTLADSMIAAVEGSTSLLALLSTAPVTASEAEVEYAGAPGMAVVGMAIRCEWIESIGSGL